MKPTGHFSIGAAAAFCFTVALSTSCASLKPCPDPETVPPLSPTEIDAMLFLIGDAGEPDPAGEPVLRALRGDLESAVEARGSDRVAVVFLGDNIYPSGLPGPESSGFEPAKGKLDAQIDVFASLPSLARPIGFFVPGNHDWDHASGDGVERIRRQGKRLAERGEGRVQMLPGDGCPGPAVVDVGERLRILALDTQWWIRRAVKPGPGSGCDAGTEEEAAELIGRKLEEAGSRHVVVAGHHPFFSGGPHGGTTCFLRRLGLVSQDLSSPRYRAMKTSIESSFSEHPPLVYAAGHEHSLQLMYPGSPPYYAVSGSGSFDNLTKVGALDATLFCRRASGFMRLDFAHDGRVRLGVRVAGDGSSVSMEVFSTWLETSAASR